MQTRESRLRFVGGVWHNQINWARHDPFVFVRDPELGKVYAYQLLTLQTERGTVFWEYHVAPNIMAKIAA